MRQSWKWRQFLLKRNPSSRGYSVDRFKRPERLNAQQQFVLDEIERTRATGTRGPFGPWLANAEIANAAQKLGRICRNETSLPSRESELVILTTAKHHRSKREWEIHEPEARKAGLEEEIISEIASGTPFLQTSAASARDKVLHRFSSAILKTSTASDKEYALMKESFSETEMVEVVAIVGYYTFVAFTLNVFKV